MVSAVVSLMVYHKTREIEKMRVFTRAYWWSQTGSNRRPLQCHSGDRRSPKARRHGWSTPIPYTTAAAILVMVGGCAGTEPNTHEARVKAQHDERKELLCAAYQKHHGISRAARGKVKFQYDGEWITCRW